MVRFRDLQLVRVRLGFRFANKSWIRDWVRVLGVVRTGIRIRDLGLVGVEFGIGIWDF